MTKSQKRLHTIETVFASRESIAARDLAQFQAVVDEAQAQLSSLRTYRDDYRTSMRRAGATDLSRLQNERVFLSRLDAAVAAQEGVVANARASCEALRLKYRQTRQRTKAVGKVCAQRRDAERQQHERTEQKEADARSIMRRTR